QPDVALVLLGHAVGRLEHGLARRDEVELRAGPHEGGDDLGLGHRVEVAALIQQQRDVGERLQPGPEPALRAAEALRHPTELSAALSEDGDDLVGLAELDRAKDDPLFLVEGHRANGTPEPRTRSDALVPMTKSPQCGTGYLERDPTTVKARDRFGP